MGYGPLRIWHHVLWAAPHMAPWIMSRYAYGTMVYGPLRIWPHGLWAATHMAP